MQPQHFLNIKKWTIFYILRWDGNICNVAGDICNISEGKNRFQCIKARKNIIFANSMLTNIGKGVIIPIDISTVWSFGSYQLQDSME